MKTTSTAQYAADAANSSCRLAFVREDMAAENKRVNTTRTPMAVNVEERVPMLVSWYMTTTGNTRRMKMMTVMMSATKDSTRFAS